MNGKPSRAPLPRAGSSRGCLAVDISAKKTLTQEAKRRLEQAEEREREERLVNLGGGNIVNARKIYSNYGLGRHANRGGETSASNRHSAGTRRLSHFEVVGKNKTPAGRGRGPRQLSLSEVAAKRRREEEVEEQRKEKRDLMRLPSADTTTSPSISISPDNFYLKRTSRRNTNSVYSTNAYSKRRDTAPSSPLMQRESKRRKATILDAPPKKPVEEVIISDGEASEDEISISNSQSQSPQRRKSLRLHSKACSLSQKKVLPDLLGSLKFTWKSAHRDGVSVSICAQDMESLEESEFLNDTIMDFYINFLLDDMPASSPPLRRVSGGSKDTSSISRDDIFIFSTFFYKKLVDSAKNKMYSNLDKWTKNVDIFSKKYIFVPVCVSLHWSLVLIQTQQCFNENNKLEDIEVSIMHVDSMHGVHHTANITKNLRPYLAHEWQRNLQNPDSICHKVGAESETFRERPKEFTRHHVLGGRIESPKQNKGNDCGLFVLKFFQKFLSAPPTSIDVRIEEGSFLATSSNESSGKFSTGGYFTVEEATNLRIHIRMLLCDFFARDNPKSSRALKAQEIAREKFREIGERKSRNKQKGFVTPQIQRKVAVKEIQNLEEEKEEKEKKEKKQEKQEKREEMVISEGIEAASALRRAQAQHERDHSEDAGQKLGGSPQVRQLRELNKEFEKDLDSIGASSQDNKSTNLSPPPESPDAECEEQDEVEKELELIKSATQSKAAICIS